MRALIGFVFLIALSIASIHLGLRYEEYKESIDPLTFDAIFYVWLVFASAGVCDAMRISISRDKSK